MTAVSEPRPRRRQPLPPGVAPAPKRRSAWDALRTKTVTELRALGCRPWNRPGDGDEIPIFCTHTLMLLPCTWFKDIPYDFELVTITGETKPFTPKFPRDGRVGMLAFGILIP